MKLRLFASHAFERDSLILSMTELRAVISEAVHVASSRCANVECDVYFEDAAYGDPLPRSIRSKIEACDLFICDISGLSPNVLYELGYAHALGKELVLLRDSSSSGRIPSDVSDLLVAKYVSQETVRFQLQDRLTALLLEINEADSFSGRMNSRKCAWFSGSPSHISVVCSSEPEKTRFADPKSNAYIFIDNLEDRDALVDVSMFLSRCFPNAGIQRQIADGLSQDALESNIVVLGGPKSNSVSGDMLALLNVPLIQNNKFLKLRNNGGIDQSIEVTRDDSGLIVSDAGYLGIFSNPLRPGTRVVLCIGSNIFGTLGAAKALDDSVQGQKNSQIFFERLNAKPGGALQAAEMLFSVPVMKNRKVPTPVLESDKIWLTKA